MKLTQREKGSPRDNGLEMTFAKSCLYYFSDFFSSLNVVEVPGPCTFPPVVVMLSQTAPFLFLVYSVKPQQDREKGE